MGTGGAQVRGMGTGRSTVKHMALAATLTTTTTATATATTTTRTAATICHRLNSHPTIATSHNNQTPQPTTKQHHNHPLGRCTYCTVGHAPWPLYILYSAPPPPPLAAVHITHTPHPTPHTPHPTQYTTPGITQPAGSRYRSRLDAARAAGDPDLRTSGSSDWGNLRRRDVARRRGREILPRPGAKTVPRRR